MLGYRKSLWAKSAGTALGFIVGGAIILLVQNGLAQGHNQNSSSARSRKTGRRLHSKAIRFLTGDLPGGRPVPSYRVETRRSMSQRKLKFAAR